MELVRSNRTETLVDALASKVRANPLPPLQNETIVVQSRGFESWLTLELARRLGVWANPSFPFPRHLIERMLDVLDPDTKENARVYDRERLKWTVAELLSESPPSTLERYLGADTDRVLRLASNVASVFDDYVVYRPDLLSAWAAGRDDGWQSELWKAVVAKLGPHDLSSRMTRALERLRRNDGNLDLARLHLFSLETLPPHFLRFFAELSKRVPTTLYVLEPSQHYLSDAGAAQLTLNLPSEERDGHPFLIGAGRLARDFQDLLIDVEGTVDAELSLFDAPDRSTLLRSVQTDIREFEPEPAREQRAAVSLAEQSISVHACTGPMREVQVLHDLIRDALEHDRSLKPEDVVVMAPELDTYAPLFRAVFEEPTEHRIPFDVHDRRSRDDSSFYDDFALVLELLDSRFSVLDVVRLMDAKALRNDFCFTSEERARLTDLLAAAGVRWGIDGDHRAEEGFPNDDLHTWREGLGRLFLGFTVMPDTTQTFGSLLPRGAPTLEDAGLVARLSKLCDVLFGAHSRTRGERPIERWADELGRLCGALFSEDDETSRATHLLRSSLNELRDDAAKSGFSGVVSLRTLRRELDRLLVDKTPAVGFLRRGVTLTELVPLRSVPFRMVCLVGMSEDAFPRPDQRPSFDLMRSQHRKGDRNRRNDDRHSFLQAVLCARDRLVITYSSPVGTHRVEPNPSPLVWELTETINRYYRADEGDEPRVRPTVHPLHAFDRSYFTGEGSTKSFSTRYLEVARVLASERGDRPRVELVATPESQDLVTVGELTKWLWNPSKAFIDAELQTRFETRAVYEPTNALLKLGFLEAANVGNAALDDELRGDALRDYLAACPEFPDGNPGELQRERLAGEIGAVARRAEALRSGKAGRSEIVRAKLGDVVVEGRLRGLCDDSRVVARFSRVGRRAEIVGWIEHLLMLAAKEGSLPSRTELVLRGTDTKAHVVGYAAVEDPAEQLRRLVDAYRSNREAPWPLFEGVSLHFVQNERDKGTESALKKARSDLESLRKYEEHLEYVLGPDDPFADETWRDGFQHAAREVYETMVDHRGEG
jgi:exodeoxyribonuclease V gamma subunit